MRLTPLACRPSSKHLRTLSFSLRSLPPHCLSACLPACLPYRPYRLAGTGTTRRPVSKFKSQKAPNLLNFKTFFVDSKLAAALSMSSRTSAQPRLQASVLPEFCSTGCTPVGHRQHSARDPAPTWKFSAGCCVSGAASRCTSTDPPRISAGIASGTTRACHPGDAERPSSEAKSLPTSRLVCQIWEISDPSRPHLGPISDPSRTHLGPISDLSRTYLRPISGPWEPPAHSKIWGLRLQISPGGTVKNPPHRSPRPRARARSGRALAEDSGSGGRSRTRSGCDCRTDRRSRWRPPRRSPRAP